jgi:aminopeptidase YwaD
MRAIVRVWLLGVAVAVGGWAPVVAQTPPLLPEQSVAALAGELSGELARRNLEMLAQYHRMRGSRQFRAAAEFIAARSREYGLAEVALLQFSADGTTFYGTQRARPAWDAEFAELWEVREEHGRRVRVERLASFAAMPVTLAQDSESAEVTAQLVDCGEGTREADYAGKPVRGNICLVAVQPGAALRLAVERFGAAGMVSYAQNQRQAWWGENQNLVRWGHLDSFTPTKTFAFMVSPGRATVLRERLARGERIVLEANVKAGRRTGFYDVVTATIPGTDETLRNEEIVFSCHLDHQRPGANDNASGCATILEVGRALAKLIREGRIPPPARTLRFVWPPEIEGTMALLNAWPEWAARIRAVVHMDMVGGGPETKAVFHVTRGPLSLPSFVHDIAEAFVEFVNEQSYQYATTGRAAYPLVAREGGKEPLQARLAPFSMGSDHQVYTDSSWAIPAIYLNDWPDRYIHTNFDSPANIDPTKLLRAGFIGAASGYFLARIGPEDEAAVLKVVESGRLRRLAIARQKSASLPVEEAENLQQQALHYEAELVASLERFLPPSPHRTGALEQIRKLAALLGVEQREKLARGEGFVFRRRSERKGPMSVFGYDYFEAHCAARNVCNPELLRYQGRWGGGEAYAYEVLNLADGRRTAQEIRDVVAAEYGPVPLELVVEYLRALEAIGVVELVRSGNSLPGGCSARGRPLCADGNQQ